MDMERVFAAAAVSAPLLVGAWRQNAVQAAGQLASLAASSLAPDACTLLTVTQVSVALGVTSLPGRQPMAGTPDLCIWSDDPTAAISNRRVTLSIIKTVTFDAGKSSDKDLTIESVTGIGDEAYYAMRTKSQESPYLNVRKGGTAFQVRILNGLKFKEFTLAEEKAKEADLAKAAAAKL